MPRPTFTSHYFPHSSARCLPHVPHGTGPAQEPREHANIFCLISARDMLHWSPTCGTGVPRHTRRTLQTSCCCCSNSLSLLHTALPPGNVVQLSQERCTINGNLRQVRTLTTGHCRQFCPFCPNYLRQRPLPLSTSCLGHLCPRGEGDTLRGLSSTHDMDVCMCSL